MKLTSRLLSPINLPELILEHRSFFRSSPALVCKKLLHSMIFQADFRKQFFKSGIFIYKPFKFFNINSFHTTAFDFQL